MRFWIALATFLLFGCGSKTPPQIVTVKEPVIVDRPVIVKAAPPPELMLPLKFTLPTFVAPTHPEASSALTAQGEREFREAWEELIAQLLAWRASAK